MKRGFTLVELLATLVLLGAISMLAVTSLNNQIKRTNEATYESFASTVYLAVDTYITSDKSKYPDLNTQNQPVCINLKDVVLKNLLSSKLINPKTEILLTDSSVTVKLNDNNKYDYTYNDNQLCE